MPRCKNCKEKFEGKHFNQKYCFKENCVKAWVESAKVQNWKKTKKQMKEKLETTRDLINKAQRVFNEYIRLRDIKNYNTCISCGKELRKGNIDAGHYFSAGGHGNIRFNPDNVHAQCSRPCNKDKSGDILNYQIGIQERIGGVNLIELYAEAHKEKKWTKEELKEIIKTYKKKINEIRND
jgi:hypothetical protein